MKTYLFSTIVCAALAAQPVSYALTTAQAKAARKAIAAVTFPELPAKAAELVRGSAAADREEMAVLVVQAAIARSRPSAPLVVAAISKAAPEVAATATVAATALESSQASQITVAAVAAAPASQRAIIAAQSKSRGENGNGGREGENTRGNRGPSDPNARGNGRAAEIERQAPVTKPENNGRPPEHSNAGGRFPQHPPHGGKPPGHDENHDGRPDWVDYSRPRGL